MITHLAIRDLVLAEALEVSLGPGLVALTGETGAGKSLIGQALALATGRRSQSGLIRRGSDAASVEMVLEFVGPQAEALDADLDALGLPPSEAGRIVLRRQLHRSRGSRAWINGQAVSLNALSSLWSGRLRRVDQGAATALADPQARLALFDRALPKDAPTEALAEAVNALRRSESHLRELKEELARNQDHRQLLNHWVAELDDFGPEPEEWDDLIETRRKARQQKAQRQALDQAERIISGSGGILEGLGELRRVASEALEPEPLHDHAARADEAIDLYLRHLQAQSSALVKVDEDGLQERIFRWRDLARKHRCSEQELPERHRELCAELERLDAPEASLDAAQRAVNAARVEAEALASTMSQLRRATAETLGAKLNELLRPLGFAGAELKLEIQRAATLGAGGWDLLEMPFQANPGEGFAPVERSASGGEKARLMLALDCSLPRRDTLCSLFYDEVDAGLGGRAAQAVANLLRSQGEAVQVLVVTHQAAVAAAASQHLEVRKVTEGGRTRLTVKPLGEEARQQELARMTSGDVAPEAAVAVAKALRNEGKRRGAV